MGMDWLRDHADQILAVITTILAAGHLEHLFSAEWLVVLSAVLTVAATFLPKKELAPMIHQQPVQQPPKGPQK